MSYVEMTARAIVAVSVIWGLFLLFPELDLGFTALFYIPGSPEGGGFAFRAMPVGEILDRHRNTMGFSLALGIVAVWMIVALWQGRGLGLDRFQGAFLALSFALGPGLLVNGILKEFWGRARPLQIDVFGGSQVYTPPLVIADQCESNCAFVSGDAAFAFTFLAFAVLASRHREFWIAVALGFGIFVSLIRVVMGAHFLSDVVFAGIFMTTVIVMLHRFIVQDRFGLRR